MADQKTPPVLVSCLLALFMRLLAYRLAHQNAYIKNAHIKKHKAKTHIAVQVSF